MPVVAALLERGSVEERKTAYRALGTLREARATELLAEHLKQLADGRIEPAVELELREAAERRREPTLRALLDAHEARLAANKDPLAVYRFALEGGDARRGKRVFDTQPVMSCARCHRVGNEVGGEAGPNLAGIGAVRTRAFLLESIVKPNAHIAAGFDSVVLTLKSGGVAAGIVAAEDDAIIKLRDADGKIAEVRKAAVEKRESAPSAMPEIYGALLTKSELRDVVAYLASLTSPAGPTMIETRPRALRARVAER